jgi:hypothetical protein
MECKQPCAFGVFHNAERYGAGKSCDDPARAGASPVAAGGLERKTRELQPAQPASGTLAHHCDRLREDAGARGLSEALAFLGEGRPAPPDRAFRPGNMARETRSGSIENRAGLPPLLVEVRDHEGRGSDCGPRAWIDRFPPCRLSPAQAQALDGSRNRPAPWFDCPRICSLPRSVGILRGPGSHRATLRGLHPGGRRVGSPSTAGGGCARGHGVDQRATGHPDKRQVSRTTSL